MKPDEYEQYKRDKICRINRKRYNITGSDEWKKTYNKKRHIGWSRENCNEVAKERGELVENKYYLIQERKRWKQLGKGSSWEVSPIVALHL